LYYLFNTFCSHKIVGIKSYTKDRRKIGKSTCFFVMPFAVNVIGFFFFDEIEVILSPALYMCIVIASELIAESTSRINLSRLSPLITFVATETYESYTIDTVINEDIVVFTYIMIVSLSQVLLMIIIIFRYESFRRKIESDPYLIWNRKNHDN